MLEASGLYGLQMASYVLLNYYLCMVEWTDPFVWPGMKRVLKYAVVSR